VTVFVRGPVVNRHRGFRLRPVFSLPTKQLDTITRTFVSTLLAVTGRFDVIHYHGVGPATLSWIPRLFARRSKVVVTFHSIDRLHQKWGLLARAYLRLGEWSAMYFPHRTIVVSRNIQKYCDRTYRTETDYIPNGATIGEYPGDDQLKNWGLRPNGYILTVGRFIRPKGMHHLIEAFARLQTDLRLVIVGGGGADRDYEDFIRFKASGDSCIVFTGFQTGRALQQLYANAYVYVQPSEIEGLALTILEAMSFGRCVLTSDIPENREPLDGSGVTFVSGNVLDLTAKLQSLINHPEVVKLRGERATRWIAAEYSWERVGRLTEELYADLTEPADL
ncbi:MAG: glycosyltransferase family 4 protein, partial [bacterium]